MSTKKNESTRSYISLDYRQSLNDCLCTDIRCFTRRFATFLWCIRDIDSM